MKSIKYLSILFLILSGCSELLSYKERVDIGEIEDFEKLSHSLSVSLKQPCSWQILVDFDSQDKILRTAKLSIKIENTGKNKLQFWTLKGNIFINPNETKTLFQGVFENYAVFSERFTCVNYKPADFVLHVNFEEKIGLTKPLLFYAYCSDSI